METLFAWNVVSSRSQCCCCCCSHGKHRGNFGRIGGNLQMFVNTHVAAESREDSAFKHSDVECLLEVGCFFVFLRNHDHWAGLLDLFGARPLACHYKPKLALRLHPFPLSLSWVTQWANYKSVGAVCVLQPLKNTTAFFYRVFNRNVCIHQEEFNWTWFCSDFLKKKLI